MIAEVSSSARAALDALVRIPSVSAAPTVDLTRAAELTATLFRDAGMPEVEIVGTYPTVLARHPAPPGRPTVLLYAHHDVQPAGPPHGWTAPPFEPSERDGRLYGRGTADDKAGIATHLAAVLAHGGRPPCGVTVLVEGDEEIGSPGLPTLVARYRDRLAADVVVLADSENLEVGTTVRERPRHRRAGGRGRVEHAGPVRQGQGRAPHRSRRRRTPRRGGTRRAPDRARAVGAQVSVTTGEVSRPFQADASHPLFTAAERAYRTAYGRDVVHVGSVPFVAEFAAAFPDAAILVTSAGADNDSRAHGPDESVHLAEFERACLAEALLLTELGAS